MTTFNYQTEFKLSDETKISEWISDIIDAEGFQEGDISYTFCDDNFLLKINQEHLDHDTFTDIITFDYSVGKILHADIFISTERVKENSIGLEVSMRSELMRVIAHGILHLCGYNDKNEKEIKNMRSKEDHYLQLMSY